MFSSKKNRIKLKVADTLIGRKTVVKGDLHFSNGLHIDGIVEGSVIADKGSGAVVTISEFGQVAGEINVPKVVLNGRHKGNIRAHEQLELLQKAYVEGDVYYTLMQIEAGATVNGKIVCVAEEEANETKKPVKLLAGNGGKSERSNASNRNVNGPQKPKFRPENGKVVTSSPGESAVPIGAEGKN